MNPLAENPGANTTLWQLANDFLGLDGTGGVPADLDQIESIALEIYKNLPQEGKDLWDHLLTSAKGMECVQVFISNASVGKHKTYQEMVEYFGSPCERLVVLHLVNALIANEIPVDSLYAINLEAYKPIRPLIEGEVKYSLLPFKEAYFPKLESFTDAFKASVFKTDLTPHPCINHAFALIVLDIVAMIPRDVIWNCKKQLPKYGTLGNDSNLGANPLTISGMC